MVGLFDIEVMKKDHRWWLVLLSRVSTRGVRGRPWAPGGPAPPPLRMFELRLSNGFRIEAKGKNHSKICLRNDQDHAPFVIQV
eukprot:4592026-Prymnesium_polylepis.1